MTGDGYIPFGAERTVHRSPALADGVFWRCKQPDGTRRCFFAAAAT